MNQARTKENGWASEKFDTAYEIEKIIIQKEIDDRMYKTQRYVDWTTNTMYWKFDK